VKVTTIPDSMPIIAHGGVEIHSHLLVFERKKQSIRNTPIPTMPRRRNRKKKKKEDILH
jgi:hypothetical protein